MARGPQRLGARLFWFAGGAGLSYILLATPYSWLRAHTVLPVWAISACSVAVGAAFFFAWNYFVNFRTEGRDDGRLGRYLAAIVLMWLLSSVVLTGLKHVDAHLTLGLAGVPLDLDILATQGVLGGLKFWLYHKWVFPLSDGQSAMRQWPANSN